MILAAFRDGSPVRRSNGMWNRARDDRQEFGSAFHWHLLDTGIGHVKIRPRTPRLNGKVERSHRIDSDESHRLLEGEVIHDTKLFAERLQQCKNTTTATDPTAP